MFKEVNKDIESVGETYKGVKPSTKVAIGIIITFILIASWDISGRNYPNDGWNRFWDFILNIEIIIAVPWAAIKLFTKII